MNENAARTQTRFIATITGDGASFRASYEIVPSAPAPSDHYDQALQTFTTLGEARQWLEQEASRRGFDEFHIDENIEVLPEDIQHPTRA